MRRYALMTAAACFSCSTGSTSTADGAATQAQADALTDASADASADAGTDASLDAGMVGCEQSLAAYCAQSPSNCRPSIDDYLGPCANPNADGGGNVARGCGRFDAILDSFVDSGYVRYFDHATGVLVAIVGYGIRGDICIAGPADFVEPDRRTCMFMGFTDAGVCDAAPRD
jgi:hypothetical protein